MNSPYPLEALLTWAKVVEVGGVGRAAAELGISQPAVSARLRRLAEAAGGPLFRRTPEGLVPTAVGRALLPAARALARLAEALPATPALPVAASQTVAAYYLPGWLARAGWSGPLALTVANSDEAVRRLRAGEVELALIEAAPPLAAPDLEVHRLAEDELVLAVPRGHPLWGRRRVDAAELEGLALLAREPGSGTRRAVEAVLARLGVRPRVRLVLGGLEPLKQAVIAGLGPAFLPRVALAREARAGRLGYARIRGAPIRRPLSLLLPAGAGEAARELAAGLRVW